MHPVAFQHANVFYFSGSLFPTSASTCLKPHKRAVETWSSRWVAPLVTWPWTSAGSPTWRLSLARENSTERLYSTSFFTSLITLWSTWRLCKLHKYTGTWFYFTLTSLSVSLKAATYTQGPNIVICMKMCTRTDDVMKMCAWKNDTHTWAQFDNKRWHIYINIPIYAECMTLAISGQGAFTFYIKDVNFVMFILVIRVLVWLLVGGNYWYKLSFLDNLTM